MAGYRSLGGKSDGFGTRAGDIYKVSVDHVNVNEYDLIYNQEQLKDGSLTPELYALTGYAGSSGLIDVTYNNKTIYTTVKNDGALTINKEDGVTYIFGQGFGKAGNLFKNTNNMTDVSVLTDFGIVGAGNEASYIACCFKGDDLYLFFSSTAAVYCRVWDTITDTWKTAKTVVVSGLSSGGLFGCHYNSNLGKVVIYVKNSTNQTKFLTTSDGTTFINTNIQCM